MKSSAVFTRLPAFSRLSCRCLAASAGVCSVPLRTNTAPGSELKFFGIGVLTNVLNPKAVLFFVALFTAVITGPVSTPMKVVLGLWIPLATFGWFAFVATMLGNEATRRKLRHVAHWIDRAMGVVLLLLGAGMLVSLLR